MIASFNDLFAELKAKKICKKLVVAWGVDEHSIEAAYKAAEAGFVEATLVGDEATIKQVCADNNIDVNDFTIIQEADENKAAAKACEIINNGEGDILMKGLLSTDKYMRAILNKERGLMPGPKAVLSHVTVIETPRYHKLIICGDVAIIPAPDLNQKIAITNYLVNTARALQIEKPKVAVLAATEQVLPAMPACVDACIISKMAERGQIKNAVIDGPLGVDLAIDMECVQIKKVKSEVAGDADCIVFPNIETGNVFYKCNTKLAGAELGAMVVGAKVPCVLSSRGDSTKTKLYSIALAAAVAK